MVFYDITTGWLTWVNQSLADGTDPRSGRNLFNKARHARFEGDLSQGVLLWVSAHLQRAGDRIDGSVLYVQQRDMIVLDCLYSGGITVDAVMTVYWYILQASPPTWWWLCIFCRYHQRRGDGRRRWPGDAVRFLAAVTERWWVYWSSHDWHD